MGEKLIGCDSDECGADVFVGVGEQEVVAELFDSEGDGGIDQELIVVVDGEVVDGVVAFGESETISTVAADEGVIARAAVEEIVLITTEEPIVAGFAFEDVIVFAAT